MCLGDWVKKWKREEKLQRTVSEKQADWVKKSKQEEMPQQEGGEKWYVPSLLDNQ